MAHVHPHHEHSHGEAAHAAHGTGSHHHAPASYGRAFAIGIALNLGFTVCEAAYGVAGHSVSLLADAGHNLSDGLGLLVAFGAHRLASHRATPRFTYGLGGSSILAALFNAVVLLVLVGGLSWEALLRFAQPEPVAGTTVMAVAAIGIAVNGATAWLFFAGRDADLNVKGAFLHMAADALVSAGVVVSGLVIALTGWLWVDPATSLAVNLVIVAGTWGLLRDSVTLALQGVPGRIAAESVARMLADVPGVAGVHDLHIWATSTSRTALTAHVVMPAGHPGDAALVAIGDRLRTEFGIAHATLQVETSAEPICGQSKAAIGCRPQAA